MEMGVIALTTTLLLEDCLKTMSVAQGRKGKSETAIQSSSKDRTEEEGTLKKANAAGVEVTWGLPVGLRIDQPEVKTMTIGLWLIEEDFTKPKSPRKKRKMLMRSKGKEMMLIMTELDLAKVVKVVIVATVVMVVMVVVVVIIVMMMRMITQQHMKTNIITTTHNSTKALI